ncbi:MAG: hypothetical protein ACTSWZ_03170 [Candidatus Heimdallarchaeaceae archaeon]
MKAALLEIKGLLSELLNSKDVGLRLKCLNGVMELLNELEMDFTKIEHAIKLEAKGGNLEKVNGLIIDVLKEIDKEEYCKDIEEEKKLRHELTD